jgi:hypothetical protein
VTINKIGTTNTNKFVIELLRGRLHAGLYRGIATDNNEPLGMMRVRVRIPGIKDFLPSGALACPPPGTNSVPEVGTTVWIEFEAMATYDRSKNGADDAMDVFERVRAKPHTNHTPSGVETMISKENGSPHFGVTH